MGDGEGEGDEMAIGTTQPVEASMRDIYSL